MIQAHLHAQNLKAPVVSFFVISIVNQAILTRLLAGKDGTYCTMIGAEVGCCAIGKICDSLCLEGETACGSVCCPKGQDCSTDEVCVTGSGSGEVCGGQAGFAQCSNMDGCCPEGVKCLPPDSCDIQCTASDPVCGTSCCLGGSVCVNDSTCVVDSGSGGSSASFTPVATTSGSSSATKTAISDTTSSTSSNESSGETTKTTKKTTTKKTTTTDDSTTPTDTTTGATRSTKVNVKTQTVTPNNAASFPTMAAMLGGGLGGIAAGYLAM